jgi:molybdate transport system substrate-binding protein
MQTTPFTSSAPVLKGISSMATRQLLTELLTLYAAQGGCALQLESVGGVDSAKRVQAGEAFDIVFLASDAIDTLVAAGLLDASSKLNLADSGVALAVRAGALQPDISSAEAVRAAVLIYQAPEPVLQC